MRIESSPRVTALPAGRGMYRIPAFTLKGVEVPMCTIMLYRSGWVANLDGSTVKHDVTGATPQECAHIRIQQHLAQHGVTDSVAITFTTPYVRTFTY